MANNTVYPMPALFPDIPGYSTSALDTVPRDIQRAPQFMYHFKCVHCGTPFDFNPSQEDLIVCHNCGLSGVVTTELSKGGYVVLYFSENTITSPESICGTVTRAKGGPIAIDASQPPGEQTWCREMLPSSGPYKAINGPPVLVSKQPLFLRYGQRLAPYGRYNTYDSCRGLASIVNTGGYLLTGHTGIETSGFVSVDGNGLDKPFHFTNAPAGVLNVASHYTEVLSEQIVEPSYDEPDDPPENDEPWEESGQEPNVDLLI
jgi:hypothetical protein